MMMHWRGWRAVLLGLAMGLTVTACGETVEMSSTDNTGERAATADDLDQVPQGIHMRPGVDVVVLDEFLSQFVIIDETAKTVRVTSAAADYVRDAASGDVLFGDGFVYRIADTIVDGDDVLVAIEPFYLAEVIHGEWDIPLNWEEVEFDWEEASGEGDDTLRRLHQELGTGWNKVDLGAKFGQLIGPGELSGQGTFTVAGNVEFPVSWDGAFQGRIPGDGGRYTCSQRTRTKTRWVLRGWRPVQETYEEPYTPDYCVDHLLAKANLGFEVTSRVEVSAEVAYELEKKKRYKANRELTIPMGALTLYATPFIEFGASAKAYGAANANFEATSGLTVPVGFEYKYDEGSSLLPNANHKPQTTQTMSADATGEVGVEAGIYVELGLLFYVGPSAAPSIKVGGPLAGGRASGKGQYVPVQVSASGQPPEPCLRAWVEVAPRVAGKLEATVELWKWNWTLELTEEYEWTPFVIRLAEYKSTGSDFCLLVDEEDPEDPEDPNEQLAGEGEACSDAVSCVDGLSCYLGYCVADGDLRVSLSWQTETDLDLNLLTPTGEKLWYRNRDTSDGGIYEGDACINSACDGDNVEHIRWSQRPTPGTYEVWIINYNGNEAADFVIDVARNGNTLHTFQGTLPAQGGAESQRFTFDIQ